MQNYKDSESDEDINFQYNFEDSSGLNFSSDDSHTYYTSYLDDIIKNEFQNPEYLQELSIDGNKFEYQQNSFKYNFPLRSGKLYFQPKLTDLFDFIRPDNIKQTISVNDKNRFRRGDQNCLASCQGKIAIGLTNPSSILLFNLNASSYVNITTVDGEPVAMDMDQDHIVCGFDSGHIGLFDAIKGVLIQSFIEFNNHRILALKIICKTKDEHIVLGISDVSGQVQVIQLLKGFFNYELESHQIYKQLQYPAATLKVFGSQETTRYIALSNIQKFWIIKIKILPQIDIQILIENSNPFKINPSQVFSTCCCIGRGLIRESKRKISRKYVAICCWDQVLFTVSADDLSQMQVSKFIFFDSRIIEVSFLRDSVYVVITLKGVYLLNTININKENSKIQDYKHLYFKKETEKLKYIGQEIKIKGYHISNAQKQFRILVQALLKKTKLQTDVTVPVNYNQFFSSNLVVLNTSVTFISAARWNKIIQSFYDQGEWMNGMHYLLSIYLGTNRFVTEFLELTIQERASLLHKTIVDISLKYHKMILQVIQSNKPNEFLNDKQTREIENQNKTLFAILIEFLLLGDQYETLFQDIMVGTRNEFKDQDDSFFLSTLEPFYQECLVKYIPDETLYYILDIYKKQNRQDLIQKLIWSLDHKKIDTGKLIKLSLKLGLLKSLAVICAVGDADEFLTPIIKIWAMILLKVQQEQMELAKYYALRALALIKSALQHKDVLGRQLGDKKNIIIRKLALWLLTGDNLEKLLSFTPSPTFEVLTLLLKDENADIVNQCQLNLNYRAEFVLDPELNTSKATVLIEMTVQKVIAFNEDVSNFQRVFRTKSLAQSADFTEKDLEMDILIHFNLFQIRLFYSKQVRISNRRILQCIAFILKNLKALNFLYLNEIINGINYQILDQYKKWNSHKEVIEYLKSEYVLNVVKMVEQKASNSEIKEMIELSHLADLTNLTSLCIYLAQAKHEYKRALDFYLSTKNKLIKSKVFEWLFQIMDLLQKIKIDQYEEMKLYLINKITDLIQINSAQTRDLFNKYNSENEKIVINKLESYPELQLEYVENVLKKERDLGHKIDPQLLVLNISLLCRLNPDKILVELKQFEYPLENVLIPCKSYNIRRATAYVLQRMGQIQEAIKTYCEILWDLVKKSKQELNYQYDLSTKLGTSSEKLGHLFNKAGQQQMMQSYLDAKNKICETVDCEIQSIIETCLQNNKFDPSDEIWYILIDKLIEIKDELLQDKESEIFLKDLCLVKICKTIATIAENQKLESLLKQLEVRYSNLDLGQLKLTFQEIIQNYIYAEKNLACSVIMIQTDIINKAQKYIEIVHKGLIGKYICQECGIDLMTDGKYQSIESDDNVIFACGHAYHRGCAVEQQGLVLCQICCQKDEKYAYKLLFMNSKLKLDQLNEGLKERIKESIQRDDQNENEVNIDFNSEAILKPKVSKDTEMKRKKRSRVLQKFDEIRLYNLVTMTQTTDDIEQFTAKQRKEQEKQAILQQKKKGRK